MFAIHDSKGIRFRGSLEMMLEKKPATRQRKKADNFFWDTPNQATPVVSLAPPASSHRYHKAEQLYRQVLNVKVSDPMVHAHQVMSRDLYTLSPKDLVFDAWARMNECDIKQMPVINDHGEVISILSEREIQRFLITQGVADKPLKLTRVEDVMQADVITADPVSSLRRIAQAILDYRQPGMPIVDRNNKLVGFVSRGDVLRSLTQEPALSLWS